MKRTNITTNRWISKKMEWTVVDLHLGIRVQKFPSKAGARAERERWRLREEADAVNNGESSTGVGLNNRP
uniref:Uncharacterized protein n=1 Tax=Cannabis sativa TaxID=3483 RepID=A0A803NS64_CANSA